MKADNMERPKKGREINLPDGVKDPKNRRFFILYCVCLFLFAAGMVLLSYLAQARASNKMLGQEVEQSTRYYLSAMQTVQGLQDENVQLKADNEDLKARIDELEKSLDALKAQLEELKEADAQSAADTEKIQNRAQALDLLWQLEKYYSWGSYKYAREVIDEMESKGLSSYLPDQKNGDQPSALEEYYRLVELVD